MIEYQVLIPGVVLLAMAAAWLLGPQIATRSVWYYAR